MKKDPANKDARTPAPTDTDLPEGWVMTTLGDICEHPQYGWTTSAKQASAGLRLLRTTDISGDFVDWSSVPFCDQEPRDPEKYLLHPGDIVVSRAGSVGISHLLTDCPPAVFASYLIRLRPRPPVPPAFLRLFLNSPDYWTAVADSAAGIAVQNINASKLRELRIPLPPLAEQKRIVAKVEELLARVNAARDQLATVPSILKRFRQSVLAAACSGRLTEEWRAAQAGSPTTAGDTLPAGWYRRSLVDLCSRFDYGSSRKSDADGEVPVLRMGNIQGGGIDWGNLKYSSDAEEIAKYSLSPNTVLFNRTNSPELVGKTGIYRGERPAIFAGYLIRIVHGSQLDPEYLNYCLNEKAFQEYCLQVKSDGVSQSNINAKKLAAYELPLPPLTEQREIVRRVNELFVLTGGIDTHVTASAAWAEKLEQSILAKAFRGELVPTEAELARQEGRDYETAAAMIDRIGIEVPTKQRTRLKKAKTAHDAANRKELEEDAMPTVEWKDIKLLRVRIDSEYRSLSSSHETFRAELPKSVAPICFVGLNGSGKSNLIEAISEIFCYLELLNLPWKKMQSKTSKFHSNKLRFEVEYRIERTDGVKEILIKKERARGAAFFEKKNEKLIPIVDGEAQLSVLPRRIVGYSSGLNETISVPFFRTKAMYSEEVRDAAPPARKKARSSKSVLDTRTLYMDYESNASIILSNFILQPRSTLQVFDDFLRMRDIASFSLRFRDKRPNGQPVRLTSELKGFRAAFAKCASEEIDDNADEHQFSYVLTDQTKQRFRDEFESPEGLFMALHKWSLLNALALQKQQRDVFLTEDITKGTIEMPPVVPSKDRVFAIEDLKLTLSSPKKTIYYSGISDGEHQFVQIFGTIMLFREPGVLFLFDEPESHFNPKWRTDFARILEALPNALTHEFMISTHSPYVVSGCRGDNVFKFARKGAFVECKPVGFETYGASFDFLLTKLFDLDSLLDSHALDDLREVVKHGDLESLQKAVGEFGDSFQKQYLYQRIAELKKQKRK